MSWSAALALLPLVSALACGVDRGASADPGATLAFVSLVTGPAQPLLGDPLPGAWEPRVVPTPAAAAEPPVERPPAQRVPPTRDDSLMA